MKSNSNQASGGIGFLGLLTIVFIVLKLTAIITWSWWWVLAPIWLPLVICLIAAGIFLGIGLIQYKRSIRSIEDVDNNAHLWTIQNTMGSDDVIPATKEQRDLLEKAMADAGYTFDFEKKELKKIEQNHAWSEEDEELMKWSINNLTELKDRFGEEYGKVGDCINWLKSLRLQNTWKPNELQMECLEDAIKHYNKLGYNAPILMELLEQLKKLK